MPKKPENFTDLFIRIKSMKRWGGDKTDEVGYLLVQLFQSKEGEKILKQIESLLDSEDNDTSKYRRSIQLLQDGLYRFAWRLKYNDKEND